MGFLSKLFAQPAVDVPRLLSAVARGGGQGIVQVPYDVFSSYLGTHGTVHQAGGGAMEYFLNLDGKRHKIVIDRGLFSGLKKGQTLVTVRSGVDFSGSSDEQIASILQNALADFISGPDTAYIVAWFLFKMGESNYLNDCLGQGKLDATVEDLRSPLLNQFDASGYREKGESDIAWHQLHEFLDDTMGAVADPRRRLNIRYAATERLIDEWQLI